MSFFINLIKRISLLLVILIIALGMNPPTDTKALSVLTVTNVNDSGSGSLRQTIIDAVSGDIIEFDSSLSGQTIILTSSLTITKNLTIDGSSLTSNIQISGNNQVGVFIIYQYDVTLNNLTIINGRAINFPGGGILNDGTLTIKDSHFISNSSTNGGGAIENAGTLIIEKSTFSENSVDGGGSVGGCIHNTGTTVISESSFVNNSSSGSGGCIVNNYDPGEVTLKIDRSTFSNNSAPYGGAILNGGYLEISNSTFFGNTASINGGAILNASTALIINSTISDSSALVEGGGIHNGFADNVYPYFGTLSIANTIIANSLSGGDCVNQNGAITTNIQNLIEDGSCSASISGDPKLGALADNGGNTQTLPLLTGSSAIDLGDDTFLRRSVC